MLAAGWCLLAHGVAAQPENDPDALVRDLISEDFGRVSRAYGLLPLVRTADGEIEFREGYEVTTELAEALAPDHFASASEESGHMRDFLFDRAVALAKVLRDPELTAIARKARHPSNGRPGIPPPGTP